MKLSYRYKWYHFIWRWMYSLLLLILLPLLVLKLFTKKADTTHLTLHKNRQRFGIYPSAYRAGGVIIHCVSMGELNAAHGLIKKLQQENPALVITITTSSVTGAQHAINLFGESVQHAFLPLDLPICVVLMMRTLKPTLLVVTEVEIWPNLLHRCYKSKIPAVLINARMTDNSLNNYRRLAFLFRPSLRKFAAICAQSQLDFDNIHKLGVSKQQMSLSNNLKFDIQRDEQDKARAAQLTEQYGLASRQVLVAGSTHEGEERLMIEAFKLLKPDYPSLLLVLVPRYPHRFDEVTQLTKAHGLLTVQLSSNDDGVDATLDALVVDKMGFLKSVYCASDLVFIGGSVANKGGHNPLEAALYGKPLFMGSSIFNNPVAVNSLKKAGALKTINTASELAEHCQHYLNNPQAGIDAGQTGLEIIEHNAGAVDDTLSIIKQYLSSNR